MTEEQAAKIIELLSSIKENTDSLNSIYDLHDIFKELENIKTELKDMNLQVSDIKGNIESMN